LGYKKQNETTEDFRDFIYIQEIFQRDKYINNSFKSQEKIFI